MMDNNEYLITEWNFCIGDEIGSGRAWEPKLMTTASEEEMWNYTLQALAKLASGEKVPHYSIKKLIPKISTRSI